MVAHSIASHLPELLRCIWRTYVKALSVSTFPLRPSQQRVATPAGAIAAGADYLVIGRPITRAPDPLAALEVINREIEQALKRQG